MVAYNRVPLSAESRQRLDQLTEEIEPLLAEIAAIGIKTLRGAQASTEIARMTLTFDAALKKITKTCECVAIGSNIFECTCTDGVEGTCFPCDEDCNPF